MEFGKWDLDFLVGIDFRAADGKKIIVFLLCSSLVPKCDIQVLNGLPPKPNTKTKHWNQAMFELKRYGENIESMRDKLVVKDKSLKMLMLKSKVGRSSPQHNASSSQNSPQKADSSQSSSLSQANHSPYSPPVIEVTPSDGPDCMGSLSDTEVSSPGTPPSLQIDLKDSGHGSQDRTPSKGRAMPSGRGQSQIGAISRNSQVPGSLDFITDSGVQSVVVRSPSANSNPKMMKRKGMKAGAALSALVSTLQRKRVAEQVCSLTPVHQGAALGMPSGGQEEAETGNSKAAEELPPQEETSSPFSSMYVQSRKTAFAIVDPDQKRVKRKTAKAVNETPTPPPAKKARAGNNSAAAAAAAAESSKTDGDPMSIGDPAAFAAKVQEFSNAAISALNTATVSSSVSHPVASLKAGTAAAIRASVSTSPNSSVASNNGGATVGLPGLPKSRAPAGGGKKKAAAKKTADKNRRGKSPYTKGGSKAVSTANPLQTTATVSSALAALISAPTNSTPTSSESAATTRANFMSQVLQGTVSTPSAPAGEVMRGEAAAPGIGGDDISDFAEGTGLLADTIRKVNTSFLARVNQMTGPSDDMGYKYFEEKVREVECGSVKWPCLVCVHCSRE